MAQSVRFRVGAAVLGALQAEFTGGDVRVFDNPPDAKALSAGARLVFVEDQSDAFVDQAAQRGKRRYVFTLGVVGRTADARAQADRDYLVARTVVRNTHTALMRDLRVGPLRERDVVFRVDGIDVGGALVLGTFEAEYLDS